MAHPLLQSTSGFIVSAVCVCVYVYVLHSVCTVCDRVMSVPFYHDHSLKVLRDALFCLLLILVRCMRACMCVQWGVYARGDSNQPEVADRGC